MADSLVLLVVLLQIREAEDFQKARRAILQCKEQQLLEAERPTRFLFPRSVEYPWKDL